MYFTIPNAKVIDIIPMSGTRADGSEWKKFELILEWNDNKKYDNHASVNMWSDVFDQSGITLNGTYTFDIDIDASKAKSNGRWYNNLTAFRAKSAENDINF